MRVEGVSNSVLKRGGRVRVQKFREVGIRQVCLWLPSSVGALQLASFEKVSNLFPSEFRVLEVEGEEEVEMVVREAV